MAGTSPATTVSAIVSSIKGRPQAGAELAMTIAAFDLFPPNGEESPMIRGFFLLLACQLVGEVLARSLALPAPGPVIGLALLALGLAAWTRRRPMSDDQIAASDVGRRRPACSASSRCCSCRRASASCNTSGF